jgi:hypothetical protein
MQLCSSILVLPIGFEDFASCPAPRKRVANGLNAGGSNPRRYQIGVPRSIQLALKTKGDGAPVYSMLYPPRPPYAVPDDDA